MFVGRERHAEVNRLVDLFDEVRVTARPRLVVYSAPAGWGKTRIVQEFYARLAAGQPAPAYWPPTLVPAETGEVSGFVALTTARKTVRHREVLVAPGATIPWLWLAPPSGRLGDGSPAPVLDNLTHQVTRHLAPLIQRLERRQALSRAALQLIAAAVPLPDILEIAETAAEIGEELIEAHTQWRRQRRDARVARRVSYDDDVDRAAQLRTLLGTLVGGANGGANGRDSLPTVLVLDDAHNLDAAAASFVEHLLASDLPVLMVATTWPDRLAAPEPFARYLADAATSEQVTTIDLEPLTTDDLIGYVQGHFPATDPQISARLAERAGRNPYALRLLLDTPRVRAATRDGRIGLQAVEVGELNGGLDSLLGQHWAELSLGVRQVLVAAALLGESFLDDVLVAGLGRVQALEGLDAALASSWIRAAGSTPGTLEFVERMRFEIARTSATDVLSGEERARILAGALGAVRLNLRDDLPGDARQVLLTLHVALAQAQVETDLVAAAASAEELADRARGAHRRPEAVEYLSEAVRWLEESLPRGVDRLVHCYVTMSAEIRLLRERADGEPAARRALELADAHLPAGDELRIEARCALAECRRVRDVPDVYQSCLDLADEAEKMLDALADPSPEVYRSVMALRANIHGTNGDYDEALKTSRLLLARCENDFGRLHRHTLEALADIGYFSIRVGRVDDAIVTRRQLLVRRTEQIPTMGYLQTLATRSNLAFTLLAAGDDRLLDEVEQLVNEAYSGWCRIYGVDGMATQRIRMIRAWLWQRQGLVAERADADRAGELFRNAAEETARIVVLRRERPAASRAMALLRHGLSLACQRRPEAVLQLEEALRIRTEELRQNRSVWQVQDCAKALRWTYQRLGRRAEADAVGRRYRLPD